MELQRIRFMVNSYLRLRLEKIQSNIFYYTKSSSNSDNPTRLTQEETEFAQSHKENLTDHFKSLALRHIPGDWDSEKVTPAVPGPNFSKSVFISVREDVTGVEVKDEAGLGRDDDIDLVTGSQHILKYNVISHLVDDGSVQLI